MLYSKKGDELKASLNKVVDQNPLTQGEVQQVNRGSKGTKLGSKLSLDEIKVAREQEAQLQKKKESLLGKRRRWETRSSGDQRHSENEDEEEISAVLESLDEDEDETNLRFHEQEKENT